MKKTFADYLQTFTFVFIPCVIIIIVIYALITQ